MNRDNTDDEEESRLQSQDPNINRKMRLFKYLKNVSNTNSFKSGSNISGKSVYSKEVNSAREPRENKPGSYFKNMNPSLTRTFHNGNEGPRASEILKSEHPLSSRGRSNTSKDGLHSRGITLNTEIIDGNSTFNSNQSPNSQISYSTLRSIDSHSNSQSKKRLHESKPISKYLKNLNYRVSRVSRDSQKVPQFNINSDFLNQLKINKLGMTSKPKKKSSISSKRRSSSKDRIPQNGGQLYKNLQAGNQKNGLLKINTYLANSRILKSSADQRSDIGSVYSYASKASGKIPQKPLDSKVYQKYKKLKKKSVEEEEKIRKYAQFKTLGRLRQGEAAKFLALKKTPY